MAQENFMMVNAPLVTQGNASAGHVAPAGCRIEHDVSFFLMPCRRISRILRNITVITTDQICQEP
jgi:hypothetical protein